MDEFVFLVFYYGYEWDGQDEVPYKKLSYVVKTEKEAICLTVGTTKTYKKVKLGEFIDF